MIVVQHGKQISMQEVKNSSININRQYQKKLQTVHKVPTTFDPQPSKVATQIVSDILYHYLVKLPTNKYAYVTILHRPWDKNKQLTNEEHVNVRPQLYGLNDKNI